MLGKKKKKSDPFYRQTWFTACGIGAILLAMAAVIYFAVLRPPSPESLFAQAEKKMAKDDIEEWREAGGPDGPIARFLSLYPGHEYSKQMREWGDQIELKNTELTMAKRRHLGITAVGDEETVRKALNDEDDGNLAAAGIKWESLLEPKESKNEDTPAWPLVARKHLRELQAVEELYARMKKRVDKEKEDKQPVEGDSDVEKLALAALRCAADEKCARFHWDELKRLTKQQDDLRRWYLLAVKCGYDLDARKSVGAK